MARDRTPVLKRCRYLGITPAALGVNKKPSKRKRMMRKLSEYGVQLKEKQKVKFIYGVLERQFRLYYKEAIRLQGVAGDNLLMLLERRLDNVVYRLGFAKSRAQARQFVNHGHIAVNGKKVTIPSYKMKVGDVISLTEHGTTVGSLKEIVEAMKNEHIVEWLSLDVSSKKGSVVALPLRRHVEYPINEQLIIELYSR